MCYNVCTSCEQLYLFLATLFNLTFCATWIKVLIVLYDWAIHSTTNSHPLLRLGCWRVFYVLTCTISWLTHDSSVPRVVFKRCLAQYILSNYVYCPGTTPNAYPHTALTIKFSVGRWVCAHTYTSCWHLNALPVFMYVLCPNPVNICCVYWSPDSVCSVKFCIHYSWKGCGWVHIYCVYIPPE